MDLYRVDFEHTSTRSHEEGIKLYLVSDEEAKVMEYIDSTLNWGGWKEIASEGKRPSEKWCEILNRKGDDFEEDVPADCAAYGVTRFRWEKVKLDLTPGQIKFLTDIDIAKEI